MNQSDLKNFENLLQSQLAAFQELKTVHEELLHTLKTCGPGNVTAIQQRQKQVSLRLKTEKTRLVPLLEKWKMLDKTHRHELLRGNIGKILEKIEKIALDINRHHDKLFNKFPSAKQPAAKVVEISDIINLYR